MLFDIKHMDTTYIGQLTGPPKIKLCMCKSAILVMFPWWAWEQLIGFPAVGHSFEPETHQGMLKHTVTTVFLAQQSLKHMHLFSPDFHWILQYVIMFKFELYFERSPKSCQYIQELIDSFRKKASSPNREGAFLTCTECSFLAVGEIYDEAPFMFPKFTPEGVY